MSAIDVIRERTRRARRAYVTLSALLLAAGCGDCGAPAGESDVRDEGASSSDAAGDFSGDLGVGDTDGAIPDDSDYMPTPQPGRHDVKVLTTLQVVPSEGIPPDLEVMPASNNLDVIRHGGRVFLAWRTAPDHFASADALIHVVSSADEVEWEHGATFNVGRDLREPRFLELQGTLLLYMTVLGTDPLAFAPYDVVVAERIAAGQWSEPQSLRRADTVVWRTKVTQGQPMIVSYTGGGGIFGDMEPLRVWLDTTMDGRTWRPYNRTHPTLIEGGVSETDFAIGDDGTAFGVSRNESGDDEGFGSKICRSTPEDITDWTCTPDPRKFDSPLMFWFDGEAYLVARRNVTPTGNFDLGRDDLTQQQKFVFYQLEYKKSRKRCAIWRYEQEQDTFLFLVDLPSRGDTCFPGVIEGTAPGEFIIYNYSSPLDADEDPSWTSGQNGETRIYRHLVRFTPR